MEKEKLMVQVGKDKHDNPIYKEVKKLNIQYFDKDNVIHTAKSKPFWSGQRWMFKVLGRLFFTEKDDIFVNRKKQFWVLIKNNDEKKQHPM